MSIAKKEAGPKMGQPSMVPSEHRIDLWAYF